MANLYDWSRNVLDWLKFLKPLIPWVIRALALIAPVAGGMVYHQTSVIADQDATIVNKEKQFLGYVKQVQPFLADAPTHKDKKQQIIYKSGITAEQVQALIDKAIADHIRKFHQ